MNDGRNSSSTSQPVSTTERVRGAFYYIHGLGEKIRGGILGAADALVHSDASDYSDVQSKGRDEMRRGMDAMRGVRCVSDPDHDTVPTDSRREDYQATPPPDPYRASPAPPADYPESGVYASGKTQDHEYSPYTSGYQPPHEKARAFGAPPLPPRAYSRKGDNSVSGPSTQAYPTDQKADYYE